MTPDRTQVARGLAVVAAALVWGALVLQGALLLAQIEAGGGGAALAIWRFLGYFTILTNLLCGLVLARGAWVGKPDGARVELAAATSIAMVGLTYSLLLRGVWSPEGWAKVADVLLHDVSPIVFVAYFLIRPRTPLGFVDAGCALIPPTAYVIYALARGAADGWYAYWFLDPHKMRPEHLAASLAMLTIAFVAMSLLLTLLSNRLNPPPASRNSR